MTSAASATVAASEPDFGVIHPLRPFALAAGLSVALFVLSAVIFAAEFRSAANALIVDALSVYTIVIVLVWIVATAVLFFRPPDRSRLVAAWGRYASALIFSLHVSVVGLIWGILPRLPIAQVYYAMSFLVAYVPAQIISSPESTSANRAGIVLVLGSTAGLLASRGTTAATMLAVYVGCFGILMFVLSARVQRTVRNTVAAHRASEAAARELDRLLAVVAAERDAKTRFIAAASHDLGQPLQAASLFFDQLLRTADPGARAKAIDGVQRSFSSAETLLAHMLAHLRLEADAVAVHPTSVALRPLLSRMIAQYTPAAARAGIRLELAAAKLHAMTDVSLVERALGNLIANAIVHSHGTRALVAVRQHGDGRLRLWVLDDGIGIARADARHVFDDYYQGAVPAGDVRTGFGLGLSSVQRIAIVLGGVAGLDLRWTGGCAFFIELPRSDPAESHLPRSNR